MDYQLFRRCFVANETTSAATATNSLGMSRHSACARQKKSAPSEKDHFVPNPFARARLPVQELFLGSAPLFQLLCLVISLLVKILTGERTHTKESVFQHVKYGQKLHLTQRE